MIPETLYKFFSSNAACHTIAKGQIRFSRADLVNDPFEFLSRYDALPVNSNPNTESIWADCVSPDELDQIKQASRVAAELETARENQIKFAKHYGFLSFCERVSSPAMWGHYCKSNDNDHAGFAIGFKSDHEFFRPPNHLVRMFYEVERPQFHEPNLPESQEQIRRERLLSWKSPAWSYEEEWRLYKIVGQAKEINGGYAFDNFPFEAVTGIYFGLRCLPPLIASVTAEFQKRGHVPPRFKMKLHRTKFELEPVKVT